MWSRIAAMQGRGVALRGHIAIQQCDSGAPDTDNRWRVMSVVDPQGQPGEVSNQQLTDAINNAIASTPSNCNTVQPLSYTPSDPPTAADWQVLADKTNELIATLRR